jgi:hypothetical protein
MQSEWQVHTQASDSAFVRPATNQVSITNMNTLSKLRLGLLAALVTACTPELPTQDPIQTVPFDNVVLQKLKMSSGDPAELEGILEKLIGSWHQSPENFSDAAKAWMLENDISGFYDTFSWGTNKAWIDFGDFRISNGEPEKMGVGMISWHTGFKHLRFRESGARGGFVDGMIEIVDENTLIRHFEFFAPDGAVSYYTDTWTFDPTNTECFTWQSTAYENGEPDVGPARKFCKESKFRSPISSED